VPHVHLAWSPAAWPIFIRKHPCLQDTPPMLTSQACFDRTSPTYVRAWRYRASRCQKNARHTAPSKSVIRIHRRIVPSAPPKARLRSSRLLRHCARCGYNILIALSCRDRCVLPAKPSRRSPSSLAIALCCWRLSHLKPDILLYYLVIILRQHSLHSYVACPANRSPLLSVGAFSTSATRGKPIIRASRKTTTLTKI
jgi:hypothetical protein